MVTHFGQTLPYIPNHREYNMFDAVRNELGKTYQYEIEIGEMKAGSDIVRVLKTLKVRGDDLAEVLEQVKLSLKVVDTMELK
jgi:hypothetical protein